MKRTAMAMLAAAAAAALAGGPPGCRDVTDIEPPGAALESIEVRRYSGGEASLALEIMVTNPNDFVVDLAGARFDIQVAGLDLGEIGWQGQLRLPATERSPLVITVVQPVGDDGAVFTGLIDHQTLGYSLTGELDLARGVIRKTYPIEAAGLVNEAP